MFLSPDKASGRKVLSAVWEQAVVFLSPLEFLSVLVAVKRLAFRGLSAIVVAVTQERCSVRNWCTIPQSNKLSGIVSSPGDFG